MNQILTLNGRINKDVSPSYVASDKGEVLERRNARVMSVDGGEMHLNVSLKGMQPIGTTTGLGTVVGFVEDKKRNWGIYFIKGSVFCSIYAYQADTDTVIKIIDDSIDPFFDFEGVIEAKMIDDILVWTDGVNQIRHLDIVRALAFTNRSAIDWKDAYYSVTDINTRLAVPTPTDNLTATWGYNSANLGNNLSNKTWQFAVQYKYKGGSKSAFSGYSPLYVHPSILAYPSVSESIKSENHLRMNIPLGNTEVVSTTLMARENQSQWFVVKEFKKSEPTDTVISYDFYDNNARVYVSNDLAVILNQSVPLKANRIETAKNRLILADVTVNYNHPDITLSLENTKQLIATGGITDKVFSIRPIILTNLQMIEMAYIPIELHVNDIINFGFDGVLDVAMGTPGHWTSFNARYSFAYNGSFICTTTSIDPCLDYIVEQINKAGKALIYKVDVYKPSDGGYKGDYIKPFAYKDGNYVRVRFDLTETPESGFHIGNTNVPCKLNSQYGVKRAMLVPIEANTFLGGSGYNVGVEYSDMVGNTSGVEGISVLNVPYDGTIYKTENSQYYLNQITATINGTPPEWAETYRFVCSKSTSFASVQSFVSLNSSYTTIVNGVSTVIERYSYITKYGNKLAVAISMPNDLDYQFVEGDFVNTKSWWVRTGMKVVGTSASITTDLGDVIQGNFILIDTIDAVVGSIGAVVTIYRPLKTSEEYIYFHASPVYDIVDGTHSIPTATLKSGDGWIVRNVINQLSVSNYSALEAFVETSVLKSGISTINVGKPTVSLKDFKQVRLQELWYGGQFIDNTGINNLRDFSNIGRLAMSESDGIIRGLEMAGDVLKAVQDNKETSVYIGKEQVTNADGTMQLIASQGFLGTINRYTSSYGSQHPQSIVTNGRDIYYFDLDNACVVRTAPNGQFAVSSYGWTSYFKEKSEQVRNAIINHLPYSILSYYDLRHNEYVIIFDVPTKTGTVITNHREASVFDEATNSWTMHLDLTKSGLIPNMVGTVGQNVLSFTDSVLWIHERTNSFNSFYGEQKELKVVGIANVSPATEKCLKAISLDSNMAFETNISTPITSNNVIGQETILHAASYNSREGKWVSPVYQNILTITGQDLDQLFVGDDMQGKYFEVELTQTSSDQIELRSMGVNILPKLK